MLSQLTSALPAHPRYDRQIIINITTFKNNIPDLTQKTETKHHFKKGTYGIEVLLVDHNQPVYNAQLLAELLQDNDSNPRIYICGHCNVGNDNLTDNNTTPYYSISVSRIVEMFNEALPVNSKFRNDNSIINLPQLKISLIACHAGVANNTYKIPDLINNSFAAQLLRAFKINGINVEIAARLDVVYIFMSTPPFVLVGETRTQSTAFHPRYDHTAKVVYSYSQYGYQEITPAYNKNNSGTIWRRQVFQTISAYIFIMSEYEHSLLTILLHRIMDLDNHRMHIELFKTIYHLKHYYQSLDSYYIVQRLESLLFAFSR